MPNQNSGSKTSFWNSGLEKIADLTHGKNVKVVPGANKIISETLHSIFTNVIETFKEKKTAKSMAVEDIQEAIKKLLPPSMADHAMAEGFKEVFSWGVMPFDFALQKKFDERYVKLLEKMKKRDEVELKRSYLTSVNEVVKSFDTDARLDKSSKLYICHILDSMSKEIIKKLNVKNVEKLTLDEARNVTKDLLPEELLQHASAEGNKMLFKFERRGLRFIPGASAHQRVQEIVSPRKETDQKVRETVSPGEEAKKFSARKIQFKSGVESILKYTHSDLTFGVSGRRIICLNLDSICDKILQKSGEKGTKKTQKDIENAVQSVLPPVMAEHAVAEAKKMIRLQEIGDSADLALHSKKQKTAFQKYKRTGLKFKDGIVAITKVAYPKGSLDQSAINHISTDVSELLSVLIKKVKELGVKNVTHEDIKKAVNAVIVSAILNAHANVEGNKMVFLHEMGQLMFQPKKRRILVS